MKYIVWNGWIVPVFHSESSPCRALRTRSCSWLDASIKPCILFWIVNVWSLKNNKLIVSAFRSGSSPHRALKLGRCSGLELNFLVLFFVTMLLSAHVERVSVSCRRDFLLLYKQHYFSCGVLILQRKCCPHWHVLGLYWENNSIYICF